MYKVPPSDFEKEMHGNMVIGYFNGKVICQSELGEMLYVPDATEGQFAVGTYIETEALVSLERLDIHEIARIIIEMNRSLKGREL